MNDGIPGGAVARHHVPAQHAFFFRAQGQDGAAGTVVVEVGAERDAVELQVGYSHSVTVDAPSGVTFEVPEPTRINVIGIDKELVGQTAADIRKVRPPEPYKGKGIRYVGEHVRRKAGKAGK